MNKDIFITTTIPYVNGEPHVGHALELVQADVFARYNRLIGKRTAFQTGTDENATKNALAAREKGIDTGTFVRRNSRSFLQLADALDVSHDTFVRTTSDRHKAGVKKIWRQIEHDLYKKSYQGQYCPGCEDFVTARDLVDGNCPDHAKPPITVNETNYFFRLSRYQGILEEYLTTDRIKVLPPQKKNEVLSFVRAGLRDISVSRDRLRTFGWGVPVPGDETQTIYVWIDALINYISGPGYGSDPVWQDAWNPSTRKVHFVGKNVWKFHAVYWPAILLSAGLPLPDEIVVHGFLTVDSRKIGKSLGNAIDPFSCLNEFGSDSVRYYLLKAISPFGDGDFSRQRLREIHNSDLANGLGNLVRRVTALLEKGGAVLDVDEGLPEAPTGYRDSISKFQYSRALDALWRVVEEINRDIEISKPWESFKTGNGKQLANKLKQWAKGIRRIGYWAQPFLPHCSGKILEAFGGCRVKKLPLLFPRYRNKTS